MTNEEYTTLCHQIVAGTINNMQTTNMKRYMINRNNIPISDEVYKSAVTSPAPITTVYTPAGTGKTQLIKDRIAALKSIGVQDENIMVLNMNVAKCKQMQNEFPNICIQTFSDFTHNLYQMNYPDCYLSDIKSITSTLKLMVNTNNIVNDITYPPKYSNIPEINEFIQMLETRQPEELMCKLTCYINRKVNFTIANLNHIHMSDYSLESMICQNMAYYLHENPYKDIHTIMINGVHNMPIPVLCTILQHASRYGCNLFITGSPNECIYKFNMAYDHSIDELSARNDLGVDTIRLQTRTRMNDNIASFLKTKVDVNLPNDVYYKKIKASTYKTQEERIQSIFDNNLNAYIKSKLDKKEQILVVAKSRNDLNLIKQHLMAVYPDATITNLLTHPVPSFSYGEIASEHLSNMSINNMTGDKVKIVFDAIRLEIANINCQSTTTSKNMYWLTQLSLLDDTFIPKFYETYKNKLTRYTHVAQIIQDIIDLESYLLKEHTATINNTEKIDTSKSNIICSTIHSAIDMNCDNVIVLLTSYDAIRDENIMNVALSRANKSEYVITQSMF